MKIQFNTPEIEKTFREAEENLLDINKVKIISYDNFDHSSFDKLNQDFLNFISKKPLVYCIWTGKSEKDLQFKYIGHVAGNYARQRLRNHLTVKHEKTGAQLKNIIFSLSQKNIIGISFVITEPHYMRKALEDWLISKYTERLEWNISGKVRPSD